MNYIKKKYELFSEKYLRKNQIYLVNEDKNGGGSCQNDVSELAWHFKNHNVS